MVVVRQVNDAATSTHRRVGDQWSKVACGCDARYHEVRGAWCSEIVRIDRRNKRLVIKQIEATSDGEICAKIISSRSDANDIVGSVVGKLGGLQGSKRIFKRPNAWSCSIWIDIQKVVGQP